MVQNRKPPAFQEYAATILSSKAFRVMTLSQRGLLFTMRLECWVNQSVPSLSNELSKYLGISHHELTEALSGEVISFFDDSGSLYTCPELEDYRQHLKEQREKQSAGGKKGAAKTNKKWEGVESGKSQEARKPLVQSSSEQLSSNHTLESDYVNDDFVMEYERASNGN